MKLIDILKEIKINKPIPKVTPPEGWEELARDDEDKNFIMGWSAPMDGWDENHEDMVSINRTPDGEFEVEQYIAYGGVESVGPWPSLRTAIKEAIDLMNEIKGSWDNEVY